MHYSFAPRSFDKKTTDKRISRAISPVGRHCRPLVSPSWSCPRSSSRCGPYSLELIPCRSSTACQRSAARRRCCLEERWIQQASNTWLGAPPQQALHEKDTRLITRSDPVRSRQLGMCSTGRKGAKVKVINLLILEVTPLSKRVTPAAQHTHEPGGLPRQSL